MPQSGADTGFGAPIWSDYVDFDAGFGDPIIDDGTDRFKQDPGFGSPAAFTPAPVGAVVFGFGKGPIVLGSSVTGPPEYPTSGGDYIRIYWVKWPKGDYQIELLDGTTQRPYPANRYCYSAIPSQGDKCRATLNGALLQFALPTTVPGTYDIHIVSDEANVDWVLEDAIVTYHPPASEIIDRLRRNMPEKWLS